MKRSSSYFIKLLCLAWLCGYGCLNEINAQTCVNADFSDGNFTGWAGTYSAGQCNTTLQNGRCQCSLPDPFNTAGFNQGPNNSPANDAASQWNQVITTSAGGNDPLITSYGGTIPVVYPGGPSQYSARIGNMWQNVSNTKTGDAESISYSFLVTALNCNFTYHYAVVLYSGRHTEGQQSYFNISMIAGAGDSIACASYRVDATTAATIGGFSSQDSVFWKPWSSVVVPLYNYIGQTVTITFATRGCIPNNCAGKHYAYAYISAECAPLILTASSSVNCGLLDTLTAPAGSATYNWAGPGIVGSSTNQVVTIAQPGRYVVSMTTFGDHPCNFSLDTIITGVNLHPDFTVPIACTGSPVIFTDHTTPTGVTAWQWNFGDGGTANTQNPSHTFSHTGAFAVKLTVTDSPCIRDTTINVTIITPPIASFTAVSPECEGSNSHIVYTGNAPAGYNYDWNFDGGTGIPVTGQGPLNISWQTPGIKTITLTVSAGSCFSLPDTEQVLVKPFPGMTLTPYTPICAGDSAVLTAANADNYTWAADSTLNDTNTAVVIARPTVTTTYSVTGTNSNCISVDSVTVGVFNVPSSTFTAASPVCIGQNSTIVYTGNGGNASTYNWNLDGGNAVPNTTQDSFLVNWLTPANKFITLTVTQSGCSNPVTDTVSVFSTPPSPVLTVDTTLGCPGVLVCFTSSPIGNTISYNWSFGDGDSSGQQNACHAYAAPGLYSVSFQVKLSPECVYDTSLQNVVTVINDPVAQFNSDVTVIQQPQSVINFTNQSEYALTYLWNYSLVGISTVLGSSTDVNTQSSFENYGQYNVTLYAYNRLGCADSITHQVTVIPPQNYFIPNVFTPNGDGSNDVFFVYLQEGATLMSFEIFDRWGEKVHDGPYPWDGNYKGKKAPDGVYVYIVNIRLVDNEQDVERKGSVTLMR